MEPLIDIGVNLAHRSFDVDRDDVVSRAVTAGVTAMIVTGVDAPGSARAVALCETSPTTLWCTAGVHPHHASQWNEACSKQIAALAAHERVVAVGECGLDFNRNYSPPDAQERCFVAQLQLAAERSMPVFMHERDAHRRFAEIVAEHRDALPGGVVHCFTGGPDELRGYLELGLHVGITGWLCDERRGAALREAVRYVPADRLMLETDAPFLTPRDLPKRPRRNEPSLLPHVASAVADLRGESVADVATNTTATTRALFSI